MTRYPLYSRLGRPQGRSGQVRKISPPPGFSSFSALQPYFVLVVLASPFVLYCTTHTTQTSMPPAGFETATPVSDQPQTLSLNRSATETGIRSPNRPARSESLYRLRHSSPQCLESRDFLLPDLPTTLLDFVTASVAANQKYSAALIISPLILLHVLLPWEKKRRERKERTSSARSVLTTRYTGRLWFRHVAVGTDDVRSVTWKIKEHRSTLQSFPFT
jgi:hypothetical protein